MQKLGLTKIGVFILAITVLMAFGSPVFADKPSWAGGKSKNGKNEQQEKSKKSQDDYSENSKHRQSSGISVNVYFGDQHRSVIRDYYSEQYHSGQCPPGLAKKNNRCMPPGQAKKWQIGRSLPREVIFYDLPVELSVKIGPPPSGHRFVRVASDILMIAVGTGLVVDAIQDLSEL